MTDLKKLFDFTTYLEGFKTLERYVGQFFWRDYPFPKRYESNADHTWRMAMMLVIFEKHLSKPIDFKRAMKMVLIHDIPELIAGDASPVGTDGTGNDSHAFNEKVAEDKFEREKRAAKTIFDKLPEDQAKDLYQVWLEFEEQKTFESKIVKALDKIEARLQVLEYTKGTMYREHFDFTMKYGLEAFAADPVLKELGDMILNGLRENFNEYKDGPQRK